MRGVLLNASPVWGDKAKLSFSQPKTLLLMLKGKFHRYGRPKVLMNDESIKFEDTVRYLGVLIEEEMKYVNHVQDTIRRVKKTFVSLMTLAQSQRRVQLCVS